jgi:hypothetical protein
VSGLDFRRFRAGDRAGPHVARPPASPVDPASQVAVNVTPVACDHEDPGALVGGVPSNQRRNALVGWWNGHGLWKGLGARMLTATPCTAALAFIRCLIHDQQITCSTARVALPSAFFMADLHIARALRVIPACVEGACVRCPAG